MPENLQLENVPAIKERDVHVFFSGLNVEPLGRVESLEAAWALLPASGSGVLTLADRVTRFNPATRSGLLLEADVCNGRSTTMLRSDGDGWRGWRWTETDGESHYVVERTYVSSETTDGTAPGLVYRQYWKQQERSWDAGGGDGVAVWTPIGTRFCGFEGARA